MMVVQRVLESNERGQVKEVFWKYIVQYECSTITSISV